MSADPKTTRLEAEIILLRAKLLSAEVEIRGLRATVAALLSPSVLAGQAHEPHDEPYRPEA